MFYFQPGFIPNLSIKGEAIGGACLCGSCPLLKSKRSVVFDVNSI